MATEPLCLDASYLIALLDARDVWHRDAAAIHAVLIEHGVGVITPDCVMNEVLTVFARRCRERGQPEAFGALAERLGLAMPDDAITWLYPHLPRWFARCVAVMREAAGAVNFHDALLRVAADEVGYRTIVSFDVGLDRLEGLRRLGSADAVGDWLRAVEP